MGIMWVKAALDANYAIRSVRKNVLIYLRFRLRSIRIIAFIAEGVQRPVLNSVLGKGVSIPQITVDKRMRVG